MIDGVKVKIGDDEYVVPPASCWASKRLALIARDAKASAATEDAWIDVLWEQIRVALLENHPDLDIEKAQRTVRLRDLADLHSAVMRACGAAKEKTSQGEAPSP